MFKQLFDIIISLFVIVIISPILLIISLFVFLSAGRPIIFKQERIGKKGVPFILYKFRSMKNNIMSYEKSPNSGSDTRFIKGGAFLREFSLDELPQLDGIVFYSLFLLPEQKKERDRVCKVILENKKTIFFAVEGLLMSNKIEHERIETIWQVQKILPQCLQKMTLPH